MGILKDVFELIHDMDMSKSVEDYFKTKHYSSIAKQSMEGTLQCATIASRSLDIQVLTMVNKALERNYASFAQIVISMNPMLNVDTDKDIAGYLKKFHQNTSVTLDLNDNINAFSELAENSYTFFANKDGGRALFCVTVEGCSPAVLKDNKQLLESVFDYIVTEKLNDKFIPKNNYTYHFANESLSRHHNRHKVVMEDIHSDQFDFQKQEAADRRRRDDANQKRQDDADKYKRERDSKLDAEKAADRAISAMKVQPKLKDFDIKLNDSMLKDNDVKKSNELVPTMLHVRLRVRSAEQDFGFVDFNIGIKTVLHPVKSDEMISNMVAGCKNNNKFFDFIRWTSGEISFLKDFLFNIDQIKGDITNKSMGSSGWWIRLKRDKAWSKIKNSFFTSGRIMPNATIVMSMEEAELIKAQYGFDLMDVKTANKIISDYFLLALVIVDNSSQIVHFKYDGQVDYQSVSFIGLERENTNKANDFKEMLKLVNKI